MTYKAEKLPFVKGYAIQSYLTAEDGVKAAYEAGFDYFYLDSSLVTELPEMWSQKRIEDLKLEMKKYDVKPILHGNYKVPLASDVDDLRIAAIKFTKREIDFASKINAPVIIHGSVIVEPRLVVKTKKQALENYLSSVKELSEYAGDRGVDIFLENLSNYKHYRPFHYIFTNEDEFEYILSETKNFMLYDVGHANIGNDDPIGVFEKYHKRIIGVSFSNNNGLRDQHLSLDKGTLDYYRLIEAINRTKWQGIVGFETRDISPKQNVAELSNIFYSILMDQEMMAV